ncbi:MgtC/SapB family protein [Kaistia dalseonensis]|uniref:Protein MgtC n=1 Tax=Kaistia dalseonensis TaxID=410840 RepID=A0ABU0HEC6_9HYPH|nr:MgtC/SapB family protein [Kaistia dalseonensis]MCX5497225.1 MgtC/SapB family protein [Kaistia dalseonensis]MDQ0439856.1 putative Mg2+ transporter-C (MgtC) family protein [Kaistia dalseonensis]
MMGEWLEGSYLATHMPLPALLLRLLMATGLGAVIGIEREWKSRPAGLRTHSLTALAAAVFTIVMLEILNSPALGMEHVTVDPVRIIEAVTAGVAFLAAGAIIQSRGEVKGLTTGAAMWLAGAVGVACGLGYVLVAIIAVAICLFVMVILGLLTGAANGKPGKAD